MKNPSKTYGYSESSTKLQRPKLKMIAIVDSEYGLAKNGEIPWSFAEDLKFFYRKTKNNIVIMGRRTFESLSAPLKNRANYVISKKLARDETADFERLTSKEEGNEVPTPNTLISKNFKNVFIFDSLENALENIAQQKNAPEIWLIGGAELFHYALERQLIDEAYITQVSKNFHANLFLKISLLNYLKKEIIEQKEGHSIFHYS